MVIFIVPQTLNSKSPNPIAVPVQGRSCAGFESERFFAYPELFERFGSGLVAQKPFKTQESLSLQSQNLKPKPYKPTMGN